MIELNGDWKENASVVRANIMHEHVHDGSHEYKSRNKIVQSSVSVYNDDLDIYGVTDCIEFEKDETGAEIAQLGGKFKVKIVEYKPTQPQDGKINESDAIQVFAQKMCADYIWKCDSEGVLYYADTRKRIKLPFDTEYNKYLEKLQELLYGMNRCMEERSIPKRIVNQKCSGCSMKDVCLPNVKKYNVRELILKEE